MPESTFRTMTPEHLGVDGAVHDLALFRDACEVAMRLYAMTDSQATDYVWNDGDWGVRAHALVVAPDA